MEDAAVSAAVVSAAFVACALAGVVVDRLGPRSPAAVALVVAAVPLAFFAPLPAARAYAALGALFGTMRVWEAPREPVPPIPRPLVFVLPIDLPSLRRAPPRLARELVGRALLHAIVGLAGIALVTVRAETGAPAVAAWAGGVLAVYGAVDALTSTIRIALLALGIESTPVQRDPVLARSIGEFWSARWNVAVAAWLRRQIFLPVARRLGARAGLVAAFAYSGLFHAYLVLAAAGPWLALPMLAFFAVQAIGALLEGPLGVARWPTALARAWTIVWLLGASPLFVFPMLACFGVHGW